MRGRAASPGAAAELLNELLKNKEGGGGTVLIPNKTVHRGTNEGAIIGCD